MCYKNAVLSLSYEEIDEFDLVGEIYTGSYQESGKAFVMLAEYIRQKGIKTMSIPVAVLLDDPACIESSNLRSKIGYIVNETIKKDERVAVDTISDCTCLICEYEGEMEKVTDIYQNLQDKIEKDGYMLAGYPREFYLKHPTLAEADRLCHIQIQIPVVQM